jgi:P4 family phage/plasmid primase-like protien
MLDAALSYAEHGYQVFPCEPGAALPVGNTHAEPLPLHDTQAAVEFLRRFRPKGPWVLTSIVPDGKTTTRTFAAAADASAWIEARQGRENVYFHVNPTTKPLASKASKEEIACLDWLYVDLDPRAGEEFADERTRILAVLQASPKKPTIIIDSGGGFQAFWRLQPSNKLQIHGNVARAEELEAFNIQLERDFDADHCHNVDRIMRLPGTINLPTAKKRTKGRLPALATVVEWNDFAYPIEQFTPAPRVQQHPPAAPTDSPRGVNLIGSRPQVLARMPEVVGVEELRAWARQHGKMIPDRCLAIIATGQDPIEPSKFPSRSEAVFAVVCALLRAEVPDEMIVAVLTGPSAIAESLREKSDPPAEARRQIAHARAKGVRPGNFHSTDDGHAKRLRLNVAGLCRFVVEWGKFICDTGKKWEIDPAGVRMLAETEDITKQLLIEAAEADDKDVRQAKMDEAKSTESLRSKNNAVALLKAQPGIAISSRLLDNHPMLLNCANGVLDLKTGELLPYSADMLLTKCLPWPYLKGASCTRLRQFLAEVLPDEETVHFVQRLFGYYLTGSTIEQILVFCYGLGANGKSIFVRVLLALLGEYAIQSPMTMLLESQNERHSTELADLRGVRLTACTETPAGQGWNEPLVKQLTGSDKIRARKLYQDHEEFEPTHKIIVVGNYRPRVKGSDLGIWRRLKMIPFERTFSDGQKDPHLLDKLLAEMPGILAWAVEGCLLWQRSGLGSSQKIVEATSTYKNESDVLGPFLFECCVLGPDARAPRPAMYAAFVKWMDEQGYKRPPSPQAFAEMLRSRGFDDSGTMRVAGKSKPVWRGVGMLDGQTTLRAL